MKLQNKLFLLGTILSTHFILHAQDRLITQNGDVLMGYHVEIGENTVFYNETEDINSPVKRIPKSELLMIRKQNGEKINLMQNETATKDEEVPSQPATQTIVPMAAPSESAQKRNEELIKQYNSPSVTYTNQKKKEKGEEAKWAYCQFFASEDSRLCDDQVEISYSIGRLDYEFVDKRILSSNMEKKVKGFTPMLFPEYDPAIKVRIQNKSDHIIFVDLGSSFFMRDGEALPYYIPTATSTSHGSSSGVGINLGGVASALGIGGAAGKIASGTSVGGSHENSSSTVVYSQRVISIPPHSTKELDPQALTPPTDKQKIYKPEGKRFAANNSIYYNWENRKNLVHEGAEMPDVRKQMASTLPTWSTFITYSFNEEITNPFTLKADFSVGRIIGGDEKDFSSETTESLGFMLQTKVPSLVYKLLFK